MDRIIETGYQGTRLTDYSLYDKLHKRKVRGDIVAVVYQAKRRSDLKEVTMTLMYNQQEPENLGLGDKIGNEYSFASGTRVGFHPSIVKGYHAFIDQASASTLASSRLVNDWERALYVVSEPCGIPIQNIIDMKKSCGMTEPYFTSSEAAAITCRIASAIVHLESSGVVHRCISTETIFTTPDWNVKLGGFGGALDVRLDCHSGSSFPKVRYTYLGNEAVLPQEVIDPSARTANYQNSDIYSLGLVLQSVIGPENVNGCQLYGRMAVLAKRMLAPLESRMTASETLHQLTSMMTEGFVAATLRADKNEALALETEETKGRLQELEEDHQIALKQKTQMSEELADAQWKLSDMEQMASDISNLHKDCKQRDIQIVQQEQHISALTAQLNNMTQATTAADQLARTQADHISQLEKKLADQEQTFQSRVDTLQYILDNTKAETTDRIKDLSTRNDQIVKAARLNEAIPAPVSVKIPPQQLETPVEKEQKTKPVEKPIAEVTSHLEEEEEGVLVNPPSSSASDEKAKDHKVEAKAKSAFDSSSDDSDTVVVASIPKKEMPKGRKPAQKKSTFDSSTESDSSSEFVRPVAPKKNTFDSDSDTDSDDSSYDPTRTKPVPPGTTTSPPPKKEAPLPKSTFGNFSDSDDSSSIVVRKPAAKRQTKPKTFDSDSSSDSESQIPAGRKPVAKKAAPKKTAFDSSDSESEIPAGKKPPPAAKKAAPKKAAFDSSDSETEISVGNRPKKAAPKKSHFDDSDSDSSSDFVRPPPKKAAPKKSAASSFGGSDVDSDDDPLMSPSKASPKKAAPKKVSSFANSDVDSDDDPLNQSPKKVAPPQKVASSFGGSDVDSDDDPLKPSKPAPKKASPTAVKKQILEDDSKESIEQSPAVTKPPSEEGTPELGALEFNADRAKPFARYGEEESPKVEPKKTTSEKKPNPWSEYETSSDESAAVPSPKKSAARKYTKSSSSSSSSSDWHPTTKRAAQPPAKQPPQPKGPAAPKPESDSDSNVETELKLKLIKEKDGKIGFGLTKMVITSVIAGGAAEKSGFKKAMQMTVTHCDGVTVSTTADVAKATTNKEEIEITLTGKTCQQILDEVSSEGEAEKVPLKHPNFNDDSSSSSSSFKPKVKPKAPAKAPSKAPAKAPGKRVCLFIII